MSSKRIILRSLIVAAIGANMLSSCGKSNASNIKPNSNTNNGITLSRVGLIPTAGGKFSKVPVVLYNNNTFQLSVDHVNIDSSDSNVSAGIVDYSNCGTIQPKGSCSIMIDASSLANKTGSFGLTVNGRRASLGKDTQSYNAVTLISYQNLQGSAENGVYYYVANDLEWNEAKSVNIGATIPLYFAKNYDNLQLNATIGNASLLGCGKVNPDGSYNIPADTSCSLMLDAKGGKNWKGIVSLNTQKVSKQAKNKSLNDATDNTILQFGYVNNTATTAAKILTTLAKNELANNGESTTIYFYNVSKSDAVIQLPKVNRIVNGSAVEENISDNMVLNSDKGALASKLKLYSSSCSNNLTLAPSAFCSLKIGVTGGEYSNSFDVKLNYGSSAGNINSLTTASLYYYATNNSPVLNGVISSGSLSNIPINTTATLTYTFVNNGLSSATIDGNPRMVFPAGTVENSDLSIQTNGCSGTIAPTQSCSIVVRYQPKAYYAPNSNFDMVLSYKYTNAGINRYSSSSVFSLFSSLNPEPIALQVSPLDFGDVAESATKTIKTTLTNTSVLAIESFGFLPPDSNKITVVAVAPSAPDCLDNIAPNASCDVEFTYGPATNSESKNYDVTFKYQGQPTTQTQPVPVVVNVLKAGVKIKVEQSVTETGNPSGTPVFTGNGLGATPYQFYNYGKNAFVLAIKYINENDSTAVASNVMIDQATAPSVTNGWLLKSNSCDGATLNIGESCVVTYSAMSPNNSNSLVGDLPINVTVPSIAFLDSLQGNMTYYDNLVPSGSADNIIHVQKLQIASSNYHSFSTTCPIATYKDAKYYVCQFTLKNNVDALQTEAVTYTSDSSLPGYWTTNLNTAPSGSVINTHTVSLAGNQESTIYHWIPISLVEPSSFGNISYGLHLSYTPMSYSQQYRSNASVVTAVDYTIDVSRHQMFVGYLGENGERAHSDPQIQTSYFTTVTTPNTYSNYVHSGTNLYFSDGSDLISVAPIKTLSQSATNPDLHYYQSGDALPNFTQQKSLQIKYTDSTFVDIYHVIKFAIDPIESNRIAIVFDEMGINGYSVAFGTIDHNTDTILVEHDDVRKLKDTNAQDIPSIGSIATVYDKVSGNNHLYFISLNNIFDLMKNAVGAYGTDHFLNFPNILDDSSIVIPEPKKLCYSSNTTIYCSMNIEYPLGATVDQVTTSQFTAPQVLKLAAGSLDGQIQRIFVYGEKSLSQNPDDYGISVENAVMGTFSTSYSTRLGDYTSTSSTPSVLDSVSYSVHSLLAK